MVFKLTVFVAILIVIAVLGVRAYAASVRRLRGRSGAAWRGGARGFGRRLNRLPAAAGTEEEKEMSDRVYKLVEVVGTSHEGTDAAIRNAIEAAARTIRHIDWFEVVETRGHVVDGKVAHFQVTLKVGFRLESE
jgi:flavin-binding protein dodecin